MTTPTTQIPAGPPTKRPKQASYGRAMVLVTGTSMLVPVVGLATAPLLAHGLGVAGRGEAGAALAPNLLVVAGATLGLPQALTFYLAKRPERTRRAVAVASVLGLGTGLLALVAVVLTSGYLSDGSPDLAHLMVTGTLLALPALLVGVLRGAAFGRQLWSAIAAERVVNCVLRLVALAVLFGVGRLSVTNAVLVMCLAPVVAGLAYLKLLRPVAPGPVVAEAEARGMTSELMGFGMRVWLGSVATMLMARLSQLLVTPLSDVEQLGLLLVAVTISDVPYIVTQAIREVSFGVNSAESDVEQLTSTSRVTTLLAVVGSVVVAVTLPFWIGFVFGQGFTGSVVPTWLLLGASCLAVPGMIAGAGLDSVGRPGLKSAALALALATNVLGLVFWVPTLGAVGAALAALTSTFASSVFSVLAAAVAMRISWRRFVITERRDLVMLVLVVRTVLRRLRPGVS